MYPGRTHHTSHAAPQGGNPPYHLRSFATGSLGHTLRTNRIYALAAAASLAFLACGLLYIGLAAGISRERTADYVQGVLRQTDHAVEEHVRREFRTLMAAAAVAEGRALHQGDEVLATLAKSLARHNTYVEVGFADTAGKAVWVDELGREFHANLAGEDFIRRALAGENALGGGERTGVGGLAVNYYAVPVYAGGSEAVEGVLFAADPQDELCAVINNSLYAAQGLAHIINCEGGYVVRSNSPLAEGAGGELFPLKASLSPEVVQDLRDDLAEGQAGTLARPYGPESGLAAYAPLDINGWYLFIIIPEGVAGAGLKTVTIGAVVTVSAATGIFVLFIALIHQANTKNRKELENLAFVDPLTGHRNFHRFLLDAERLLKKAGGAKYAVCYSDIKDFRYINDMFGRDVGDRMLRYFADFLDTISQEGEVSARLGEDTFVSLRKYKSKRELARRFEGSARHLALFPDTFSHGYKAELYGGAYLLDPGDGALALNDMLDRAIAAQEDVKFAGGTERLGFFSKALREEKLWEAEVESRMEAALENGEFEVYLQPKIDIQHGDRILGAEALVRWVWPGKGLVSPARFIGLFEKNGFIVRLDRFVFEQACRSYRECVLEGGLPAGIFSVNVSQLGLMRPDFIGTYTAIRKAYGIPAGCLELEFTESLALGSQKLLASAMLECRRNGFLCSMDDFGSGHSSLNLLRSIQVDVLKLDRQFFLHGGNPVRSRELVKNVIAMARAMGMKTVAEGIDEEGQVGQLRAMGCDAVQGYVFSKPLPAGAFKAFVQAWPPGPGG